MKFPTKSLLLSFLLLTSCVHDRAAAHRPTPGSERTAVHRPTPGGDRVVYTGSNIPQPRNRVTASPLSANTPADSVARRPGSLVPTEPVVGATNNAGPQDDTGPTPLRQ